MTLPSSITICSLAVSLVLINVTTAAAAAPVSGANGRPKIEMVAYDSGLWRSLFMRSAEDEGTDEQIAMDDENGARRATGEVPAASTVLPEVLEATEQSALNPGAMITATAANRTAILEGDHSVDTEDWDAALRVTRRQTGKANALPGPTATTYLVAIIACTLVAGTLCFPGNV